MALKEHNQNNQILLKNFSVQNRKLLTNFKIKMKIGIHGTEGA